MLGKCDWEPPKHHKIGITVMSEIWYGESTHMKAFLYSNHLLVITCLSKADWSISVTTSEKTTLTWQ